MIEFIIYEDNLIYLKKYTDLIEKILMNYDIYYHFSYFDSYTKKYEEIVNNNCFKVYLLSLEKDPLRFIKRIREIKDDWQSMIIVINSDESIKNKLLLGRLLIVDIIDKNSIIMERLKSAIQICLKNFDKRPNTLKYTYKNTIYNIELYKILYIEKEKDNKRCLIQTTEKEYIIQGNLNKVNEKLDKRFIKCNRSYIINIEQVDYYNIKKNIIKFKNKIELLGCVSRDKKKEVQNKLRRIN